MKHSIVVLMCILCLTGCAAQPPQADSSQASSSSSEAPLSLQGCSLGDVGYTIDFSAAALSDSDGGSLSAEAQPMDLYFEEAGENAKYGSVFATGTYGSGVLVGRYTVIQPVLSQGYTRDNGVALAVLQTFRQEDIEKGLDTVQFLSVPSKFDARGHEVTYTVELSKLEPFKVFCNDEIVVYNLTNQLGNRSVEEQLSMPEVSCSVDSAQYKCFSSFGTLLAELTAEDWQTVIVPKSKYATIWMGIGMAGLQPQYPLFF